MQNKFDDIRPYNQSEIAPAMQRIADSEHFGRIAEFIFPKQDIEEIRAMVRGIQTTDEFQQKIMLPANNKIIGQSISELTFDGLENLSPHKSYLFVSNHRDIMLDSSLLQYILFTHGFRTTEITFGSNLMHPQLVVDIGKSNKMFKVERSSNMRVFIKNSLHLSEYIRHTITEKGESIWIAQRNGRTKDGNDATDQGLIKMFCMSDKDDLVKSISELNIVPIAISYQYEPCDILKTRELYASRNGEKYIKQPGEDLNSILTGIMQPKGNVHISICKPVTKDELLFTYNSPNEFYKTVTSIIDQRIYKNYKLFNNNYIAHDLRSKTSTYSSKYSENEKNIFTNHCEKMLKATEKERDTLTNIFLGIYANPLDKIENT